MIKTLPFPVEQEAFPAKHIIAYQLNGDAIYWSDILARLTYWRSQLQDTSGNKIAVYHHDKIEFLSIVLILWQLNKTPIIPANTLNSTLKALATETEIFVGEYPKSFTAKKHLKSPEVKQQAPGRKIAFILFTSGTTAEPTAVEKTFEQINAELTILENHWGDDLVNTLTLGTVSHHHMYGLPFGLLWPLVSKRSFLNHDLIYLEQLTRFQQFKLNLITSPAHLDHLPETLDWPKLQPSINSVFSAGAPLSILSAADGQQKLGKAITEIYGSTETGAVAFRHHSESNQWRALAGISIKQVQGKLAINSKSVTANEWFVTEDLCEFSQNDCFELSGRADKIIKVGGKRISLTALESHLGAHPSIATARIVLLETRKKRLGAVIKLTEKGNAELIDQGKLTIVNSLKEWFNEYVEPVALPRYWRFIAKMPVNSLGKTTTAELTALFHEERRPRLPLVIEHCIDEQSTIHTFNLSAPDNLIYFEGHFPGQPILPGVVQISWANHFAKKLLHISGRFLRLEKLKFQQVIQPNDNIWLKLSWDNTKNKLSFQYTCKGRSLSSGILVYSEVEYIELN